MLFANCRHIPLDFRKNNILLAQTRVFTSKLMDEEDTIKRISIRELIAQNYNFTCSGNLNVVRKITRAYIRMKERPSMTPLSEAKMVSTT